MIRDRTARPHQHRGNDAPAIEAARRSRKRLRLRERGRRASGEVPDPIVLE